jgi:membrane protein implicated in regulation of membrane protease activity
LSFQEWLYRKAEQNAHSEILAFLMMILGMNLLMGGLILTVITAGGPNLLFYVTQQPLTQSAVLGLVLTITGFLILSASFVLVVHYDRQRSWHLKEIEKSTRLRNKKVTIKTADELLRELADENSEK